MIITPPILLILPILPHITLHIIPLQGVLPVNVRKLFQESRISNINITNLLGLNYTYLIWVYFLYYVGAGYPSWYYPYIIATLLDLVPTECGGSGGTGMSQLYVNQLCTSILF